MIRERGTLITSSGLRFSIFWSIFAAVLAIASLITFFVNHIPSSFVLFLTMGALAAIPRPDTLRRHPEHLGLITKLDAVYVVLLVALSVTHFLEADVFWGWAWAILAVVQSVSSYFLWAAYRSSSETARLAKQIK